MITLANKNLTVVFNEKKAQIESLCDLQREYVGEHIGIFKIAYLDQDGNSYRVEVEDMTFQSCEKDASSWKAVYKNDLLQVIVYASIGEELEWKIDVDIQPEYILEWVNFPQIAVPHELKDNGGTSKILWGYNEGGIIDNLEYRQSTFLKYCEPRYPSEPTTCIYPGIVESPFLAYYNEVSGLYFGAHDKEDHLKFIEICGFKKGILLEMRQYCNTYSGESYVMSFPMVMKSFQGEWQDAAQIYKDWFKKNKTEKFSPIEKNEMLPDWYGESPIVVADPVRGRHDGDIMNPNKMFPYINGLPHIERLEKELGSKIMVLLMHWEGSAPWAPPYEWPPYGGAEALQKYIDALHEKGHIIGVYCSGLGWTQYSRLVDNYNREAEFEEKNLKEVMCLSPKQELHYCKVVPGIRRGYDMCPSQQFVEDTLVGEVHHMCKAGIDYIQLMDQQHGGTSYFCYSKNHGHSPAPGKWQVDAMKKVYEAVTKEAGKVLIGTESAAAEAYIPYLLFSDNRFGLNYGTGRPVPVYSFLYHEYINNFMGNQVCINFFYDHKRSPENILERMAYSFCAGDMLTLILNENGDVSWNWGWRDLEDIPNQEDVLTFAANVNKWRRGIGKKYLHSGNMVKPYKVSCGMNTLYGPKGHEFQIEKIHTSAWQAADGSLGQILVNYNTEEVECTITLPDGQYRLYREEANYTELSGGAYTLKIDRISAVLIVKM